jgi:hypothetical protein
MQILTVLFTAIGILILPALRRSPAEEDDGFGLFIGSARPLPAEGGRAQKRSRLV